MRIDRETPADVAGISRVLAAAFADDAGEVPAEVGLVDALRASDAWLPQLSLVARDSDGELVGHVLCTRGYVDRSPALALGPVAVHPRSQGRGFGSALMHAVLGAADALAEPLVACLGDPAYYTRFGFVPSTDLGVTPPVEQWQPHFMVRTLASYDPAARGRFEYAAPFMSS